MPGNGCPVEVFGFSLKLEGKGLRSFSGKVTVVVVCLLAATHLDSSKETSKGGQLIQRFSSIPSPILHAQTLAMVGRILQAARQWYDETTEKTIVSSPWVGYANGYIVRCFWTVTLILSWCFLKWSHLEGGGGTFDGGHAAVQKKTQALWLRTLAMWYCWAGTIWSLLSGHWREIVGTFLYSVSLCLSFDLAQADYFWLTPGEIQNMAVFTIVAHSNAHPLSLMCIPALRLLGDRFWCDLFINKGYFKLNTRMYDYCSQLLLLFSFTRTFTLRVREVSKGLHPSEEAKDILRGRCSRRCMWLIGLAGWLQCWTVSLCRIWRMDPRFDSLFGQELEPLLNWGFALACPGAFLFALSCRSCGRWQSDFALASFGGLPQLWLYGESQLLKNHAIETRQIFFWDLWEELFEMRWFQCLVSTQAVIQAGSHPFAPLVCLLLFFLPDPLAFENSEKKLLLRLALLACLFTNHTVDFYQRDLALSDLPHEDEVEMADASEPTA